MDSDPGSAPTVEELNRRIDRGRDELAAGRPAVAVQVLTDVISGLVPSRSLATERRRARALRLLAMAEFETHGTEAALTRLSDVSRLAADMGDDQLIALTCFSSGFVLGRSGRSSSAVEAFDRAVERLHALTPRERADVLMNRGVARAQIADLERAVDDLARAADIARSHELPIVRFMSLHNLGYMQHLRGDVPAALRAMHEADALDVDVSRGVSLLDRGRVLLEAGLVDEAHAALQQAIEVCRGDGQQQAEAEARYELGHAALLLGRPDDALDHLRTAAGRFDERTAAAWVLRCRLSELRLQLQQLHRARDDPDPPDGAPAPDELATTGRQLVEASRAIGDAQLRVARVLAAEAAALAGDPDSATALLPRGDGAGLPLLTTRLDDHRATTTMALARDDRDAARAALDTAAEDFTAATQSASTLDLRTARLAHASVLAHLDLSLAVDEGPLAALGAVDRWRAAGSRLPAVRPVASPETAELLTARRRLREQLRDEPEASEAWDELASLEDRIAAQRRSDDPGRTPEHDDVATAGPASVDTLLDAAAEESRDLLVTAQHGDHVIAITVVNGTPELRRVGPAAEVADLARRVRADLRMLATRRLGALESSVRSSLRAGAATLASRLLGEAGHGGDRRLLVSAHGELIGLPWGLLTPDRPVVLTSSPSAWCHTRSLTPTDHDTSPIRIVRGPRLLAAAEEATQVAEAWAVTPPTEPATAETLIDAVSSPGIVHVVAHGQHHRQQPLFSSLDLTDGPCSLYDLEAARVRADQIVLAACDAGRATVRPGDELLGLSAGLLALGARTVVAPGTPVPDQLLPDIMGRLHRGLAAGVPTDEALLEATRDAPDVAGAFVVTGSARRAAT